MKKTIKLLCAIIFALVLSSQSGWAQNWLTAGNALTGTEKLGGSSGAFPVEFYVNNSKYLILTTSGDLNLNTAARRYQINGSDILWHNGNTNDIFAGYLAGNATMTGHSNTFMGNSAGNIQTSGASSTYIGAGAGSNSSDGNYNTFLGYAAGQTAGYPGSTTGDYNSIVGAYAGAVVSNSHTYEKNSYLGYNAGQTNETGDNSVLIGYQSGFNTVVADNNIFIGYQSAYNNDAAEENVAIGYEALKTQSYGSTEWSSYNVAVGNNALFSNQPTATTNGINNTAVGHNAGYYNSTGIDNTYTGFETGKGTSTANVNSYNSAYGYQSLNGVTTGSFVTTYGFKSGYTNTSGDYSTLIGTYSGAGGTLSGDYNTFLGYGTGYTNGSGSHNVSIGHNSGYYNSGGIHNTTCGYEAGKGVAGNNSSYNSFFGFRAGLTNSTGTNNTCIGYTADVSAIGSANRTALGNGAIATADNSIRLGNANVTVIEGYPASYTQVSDGRFKFNIVENVKGLEFINKLRPVMYQMDTKMFDDFVIKNMPDSIKVKHQEGMNFAPATAIVHSGFIAQEVEQTANEIGYNFDGVHKPQDANGNYGLAYAQFVVPLVKAVQELDSTVTALQAEIATLKGGGQRNNNENGNDTQGKSEISLQVELANNNQTILYQNEPNPFDGSTVIRYFVPENVSNAAVGFYDMYGKEIKKLELNEKGFGKIEVNTENLAAGIYSYSIIVDDKTVDTKKMVRNK